MSNEPISYIEEIAALTKEERLKIVNDALKAIGVASKSLPPLDIEE